jgi:hypothetical protein
MWINTTTSDQLFFTVILPFQVKRINESAPHYHSWEHLAKSCVDAYTLILQRDKSQAAFRAGMQSKTEPLPSQQRASTVKTNEHQQEGNLFCNCCGGKTHRFANCQATECIDCHIKLSDDTARKNHCGECEVRKARSAERRAGRQGKGEGSTKGTKPAAAAQATKKRSKQQHEGNRGQQHDGSRGQQQDGSRGANKKARTQSDSDKRLAEGIAHAVQHAMSAQMGAGAPAKAE